MLMKQEEIQSSTSFTKLADEQTGEWVWPCLLTLQRMQHFIFLLLAANHTLVQYACFFLSTKSLEFPFFFLPPQCTGGEPAVTCSRDEGKLTHCC